MKATDLLKHQHHEVNDLFERLEKAAQSDRRAAFDELAAHLVAHDAIEREIFYPACEREMGDGKLLREALVEHGLVEFTLFQADRELRSAKTFEARVKVLKDVVEHHVEEEEKELFPKVEKALASKLVELGEKMEARFEAALKEDFRPPLQRNVRQVIGGAVKTGPARATTSRPARAVRAGRATRAASGGAKPAKRAGAKKSTRAKARGGRRAASR
jgi:hypothetical protein